MSETTDATTVETRTTTVVDPAAGEADHDGVIPEPGRGWANWLWALAILTLCACELVLVAAIVLLAFVPADAATLVAVQGAVLTALLGFYVARSRR